MKSARRFAQQFPTPGEILAQMRKERAKRRVRKHLPPLHAPRIGLAISDSHRPKFDVATWRIFLKAVRDIRPDFVWLPGDFLDLGSITRHEPAGAAYTLPQEMYSGNEGLDELSDAIGDRRCEVTWADGNHEDRLRRYFRSGRCPPEWRDAVEEIPEEMHMAQRGWRYVLPCDQPIFPFKNFWLSHGKYYPRHHAAKHADKFGMSGLYGHTHRPQVYCDHNAHGPVIVTGMPCSRDPYAEWEHQGTQPFSGWITGFTVIEVANHVPHARNVLTLDGRAVYGGQTWKA